MPRRSSFHALLAEQPPLFDADRLPVTFEENLWKVNSVTRSGANLNWGLCGAVSSEMAAALVAFVRFNVERKSIDHCRAVFREVVALTKTLEENGLTSLREALFRLLDVYRAAGAEWRFHYIRDLYRWCSDQALDGFDDPELYWEITTLRIPGNQKGDAVRSEDPEQGPLDETEEVALRAALLRDTGTLFERAVAWTLLALGCNPANLVYLCEEDFKTICSGERMFHQLDVPRIKKRTAPRAQFKTRKLDGALADVFVALKERNKTIAIPDGFSRPLFARTSPRSDCMGTAIERFAFHCTSEDLKEALKRCATRLRVVSPRTRSRLKLTPRRLRYTFATRKVQEGCSMEALADLLDHTDLQNVLVYYSGSGIGKRLDEAIAVSIGPLVNRFMGRVVAGEEEAIDGGGRIRAQPQGRIVDVGTCGSTTLCSLFPPASCYLCPQFQPWKDAPHRDVLSELVRLRDERVAISGRPEDRIAKQFDEMILAVGQVVSLCEGER